MRFIILVSALLMVKSVTTAQESYLMIGQGGGITGEITAYKIYQNGKVLKGSGRADINYSFIARIKRHQAKEYFAEAEDCHSETFSRPGNMYYFLYYSQQGKEIRYTWGETGFSTPDNILTLYRDVIKQVSRLNFKTLK